MIAFIPVTDPRQELPQNVPLLVRLQSGTYHAIYVDNHWTVNPAGPHVAEEWYEWDPNGIWRILSRMHLLRSHVKTCNETLSD